LARRHARPSGDWRPAHPVRVGDALAEFALKLPKTYVADIHFGFITATDDAEAEREPVAGSEQPQRDRCARSN